MSLDLKAKLPKIVDTRGNLTFVEGSRHIPFEIKRVFYLYDVPGGDSRGAHAHYKLEQFIIAVSGSFKLDLEGIKNSSSYLLSKPFEGIYVPPLTWAHLHDFSSGAVALVLASDFYKEDDYIRDYESFREIKEGAK